MELDSCPHSSWSMNGSYLVCHLYDPYITDPKKKLVDFGTCNDNLRCPYKMYMNKLGGEIDNGD